MLLEGKPDDVRACLSSPDRGTNLVTFVWGARSALQAALSEPKRYISRWARCCLTYGSSAPFVSGLCGLLRNRREAPLGYRCGRDLVQDLHCAVWFSFLVLVGNSSTENGCTSTKSRVSSLFPTLPPRSFFSFYRLSLLYHPAVPPKLFTNETSRSRPSRTVLGGAVLSLDSCFQCTYVIGYHDLRITAVSTFIIKLLFTTLTTPLSLPQAPGTQCEHTHITRTGNSSVYCFISL